MLVRIFIENMLSFNKEVEFSMISGKSKDHLHHVMEHNAGPDFKVLKSGVLYGANASGKSNLMKVLRLVQKMILSEAKQNQTIEFVPFKLDKKENNNKPGKFEAEIIIQDKLYSYGFLCTEKIIVQEWLFLIKKASETEIYSRKTDISGKTEINFNKNFFKDKLDKQRLEFMADDLLPNQLFLSIVNKRNIKKIKNSFALIDVYSWFDKKLTIIFPRTKFRGIEFFLNDDQRFADIFYKFLNYFDTGVDGIESRKVDQEIFNRKIPEELRQNILEDLEEDERALIANPEDDRFALFKNENNEINIFQLMTKHVTIDNESVYFNIDEESDGTQRILDFIPAFLDVTADDSVLMVDELDRSLHPILTKKFIELFYKLTSKNKSQLVVTTHESSLLNLDLLRRDEIWFIQKDKNNSSQVYSLDEFKPRKDLEIRKGYLAGRFGAIPVISEAINLEELDEPASQRV